MNINTTKIISLLFFIFSAFYLYTAYQIQVFAFDENAPFNARTFPIYLGYAGLFFSGLKLILPDPNTIKVEHKNLEYKKTNRGKNNEKLKKNTFSIIFGNPIILSNNY